MISIIATICLTGCTKNSVFADNCDLEIAEQVTVLFGHHKETVMT